MNRTPPEDGLAVVTDDAEPDADSAADSAVPDLVLTSLRDAFVDAFNGRDLDGLLALVVEDVDCPDLPGDGSDVLADEVGGVWARSPGAVLTNATLDGAPCAVAWLPDEDGCWSRAALVCFDADDGQLTLVAIPEDADGLDRAEADEPIGDELDEWLDWREWDEGEETRTVPRRDRYR